MKILITPFLGMLSSVLFLSAWPVLAEDPAPPKNPSPEAAKEIAERDAKVTAKYLPKWWKTFQDAEAGRRELAFTLVQLCDYCAFELCTGDLSRPARPDPQVAVIRDALVKRGLRYKDAASRATIVGYLDVLMVDYPEKQVPLLRDALNDPDEHVRDAAIHVLDVWIDLAFDDHKRHRVPWSLVALDRIKPRREEFVDEIVDMLVTKALADTSLSVHGSAATVLVTNDHIVPNERRIRALRRSLDSGAIRTRVGRRDAKDILEGWVPSPPRPVDPSDPFADPVDKQDKR